MKNFLSTTALIATLAISGAAVWAQDNAATETTEAAQTQPVTQIALPEIFESALFTDVTTSAGPRGMVKVEGKLAEGKFFEAMLDDSGKLMGMHTADGTALPKEVLDLILPEALLTGDALGELAVISAAGGREAMVMVSGQDASGESVRLAFDSDGQPVEMKRSRGHKGGHGADEDRGNKMGHGKKGHGKSKGNSEGDCDKSERGERGERGMKGSRA